jgi:hypothetical protein
MDESQPPQPLVRFDFPSGASAKQIAEALTKARDEIRAKKKEGK